MSFPIGSFIPELANENIVLAILVHISDSSALGTKLGIEHRLLPTDWPRLWRLRSGEEKWNQHQHGQKQQAYHEDGSKEDGPSIY